MTVVEFFEKAPIENMITTLSSKPEKLIFVGEQENMDKSISVYKAFLKNKKYKTLIETRTIKKDSLQNILEVLSTIIKTEKNCVFDITGGEDTVILAVGMLFEKYKATHPFKMQRFDIYQQKIIDCDLDNAVCFSGSFNLSVEELISLYEGIVVPEQPQPDKNIASYDIDLLWKIVCDDPSVWNKTISALNEFEKYSPKGFDPLFYDINLASIQDDKKINDYENKFNCLLNLLLRFSNYGLVENLTHNNKRLSYRYKSPLVKRSLKKAGDVLELKTFFEARKLTQNNIPVFNDCYISVTIDWDGVIHSRNDKEKDTKNEIDVVLMHGLTPIFISCKNGKIDDNELYKLHTVATRFGGKYAKKVLIASHLDRDSAAATDSYIQRAKDMNITLVTDAVKFTKTDWQEFLIKLTKKPTLPSL